MKTIYFEDRGQDFLEWDIQDRADGTAVVVACRPFQGFVWKGVLLKKYKRGEQPTLVRHGEESLLNYRVVEIREASEPPPEAA